MVSTDKVIERLEYCAETRDGFVRGCVNDAIELIKNLEAQLQHACECYEEAEKELKKHLTKQKVE